MNTRLLYGTNEIVIGIAFFALMVAATEAGFFLGRKSEAGISDRTKPLLSTVEAAILGVLGLLLGFTMAMAVSRFEARKQLVLDEANAIGTSYLRTELLPTPERSELASLLRQYIDVRVEYGNTDNDPLQLESLRTQTARLQNEIWGRAVAYGQNDPDPVRAGLLLQSLNQAIDLESARRMAFQNYLPVTVIYVNGIVGILSAILVGYTFGLSGRRQILSMFAPAFAITLVLAVIIDLDRPRSGFIRDTQQPMIDLQHQP